MVQNKIEKQFKEKLNSREIKPSEMAWDRLDAMLSITQEEKQKHTYGWIYIAASCIGFILIATIFFSSTQEAIDVEKNSIVLENPLITNKNQITTTPNTQHPKPNSEYTVVSIIKNNLSKKDNNQNQINSTQDLESVHNTQHVKPIVQDPDFNIDNRTPKYINVDTLLASVEQIDVKEKTGKLFNNKAVVKVNPNDLLTQVDDEIELTFREKVIQSVNKKYQNVKVSITNRNQE